MLYLTTRDLTRLTGVTERMLQWWREQGFLPHAIEGHRAKYPEIALVAAAILCQLNKRHAKTWPSRIVRELEKYEPNQIPTFMVTTRDPAQIKFFPTQEELVAFLETTSRSSIVVNVERLMSDVKRRQAQFAKDEN